jgi:hypothetical protein
MKDQYLTINNLSKQEIILLLESKAGITNCNDLTDTDFMLLRSGRMCETLLTTNFRKFIQKELIGRVDERLCKVKLNYVQSIGEPRPEHIRKYHELIIPKSYMGYEFSENEIKELKNGNRLNSIVSIEFKGIKSEGIICVDRDLNLIKFLPTEKIGIPKSIGKNELEKDKIEALRKGYPIIMPAFERNDGKKFSAVVQLNSDGVLKGKFAISGLDQWLKEQKKHIEKISTIMDLQFEILENRIKVKSLKL